MLVLAMMEFIPAYNSQFIKGKLSDIQKLLRSLSGIATSTFKDSTGGCASLSAFSGYPDCGGCAGVRPIY